MDKDVERRLSAIEARLAQLGLNLKESLDNLNRSPAATCIQVGSAIEAMLRELWIKLGLKGSPDDRRFEDLLTLTTKKLEADGAPMPREVVTAIREIQLRRNDAAHYWSIVKRSAASNALGNLADVTSWYFTRFLPRADARGQPAESPSVVPPAPDRPAPDREGPPAASETSAADDRPSVGRGGGAGRSYLARLGLVLAIGLIVALIPWLSTRPTRDIDRVAGPPAAPDNPIPPPGPGKAVELSKPASPPPEDVRRVPPGEQSHLATGAAPRKEEAGRPAAPPATSAPVKDAVAAFVPESSPGGAGADRKGEAGATKTAPDALPEIPREVESKLEAARRAVAEAIVAAQDAGLVKTTIDPPPIFDILATGRADDAEAFEAKAVEIGVTPEVFGAWFTGYAPDREGITAAANIRLKQPSKGLLTLYERRAAALKPHIAEVEGTRHGPPRAPTEPKEGPRPGSDEDLASLPPEVGKKVSAARRAVAEAIVAARGAGLVDTSIDPPPILDILVTGRALDRRELKAHRGVSPEVFGAWFTGYAPPLEGITAEANVKIMQPRQGLKALYDSRAQILRRHIDDVRMHR